MSYKREYTEEFLTWLEDNFRDMTTIDNQVFYVSRFNDRLTTKEEVLDFWFTLQDR